MKKRILGKGSIILGALAIMIGLSGLFPIKALAKDYKLEELNEEDILEAGDRVTDANISFQKMIYNGMVTVMDDKQQVYSYIEVFPEDNTEGYEFKNWKIDYIYRQGPQLTLKPVFIDKNAKPETPSKSEPTSRPETAEERAERLEKEWKASRDNPENFLERFKDVSGTELVSGLPVMNYVSNGTKIIVPQALQDAEKSFEKSKSENQIVIKIKTSQCGPEFKKLLEAEAVKQKADLGSICEIKAEERTKADYTLVREITSVENSVQYKLLLPEDMKKAIEEGKTVSLLHYKEDGTFEILGDIDADNITITVETKYPSGTFAFIVK